MLSIIAKVLVGVAVGLLLLLAVVFAFASDLFSSPPKPAAQSRKVRRTQLYRGAMNPNVENVALFVEEARR